VSFDSMMTDSCRQSEQLKQRMRKENSSDSLFDLSVFFYEPSSSYHFLF